MTRVASDTMNIFLTLHRYAERQDENFATAALACVLEKLRDHEPEIADPLIAKLTCVNISDIGQDRPDIGIQERADGGEFFDLSLEAKAWKAVVEVKVKSPVDV